MPEFSEPVEFKPHPNELKSAVYGSHTVTFRYDDREFPVTFSLQGDPDHSDWEATTADGDLNWRYVEISAQQANRALDEPDGITVETDDLLLVISGEYEPVSSDRSCPVEGCGFLLKEHHDGRFTCTQHGEQVFSTYETENEVPETTATALGDFA